jgi:hypothetical protein
MKPMASAGKSSKSSVSSEPERKPSQPSPLQYVLCIKNRGYPASLEVRKVYKALADPDAAQHGLLRVVDESLQDYLYPRDFFVPIFITKGR